MENDEENETLKTPNRRKAQRPQNKKLDPNDDSEEEDGNVEEDEELKSPSRRKSSRPQKSLNGSASETEHQSSPVRSSIKTSPGVCTVTKQSSVGSPARMSQKIQDLVQSDVDNILQMVQANKAQSTHNSIRGNRSDEVVILVVGENKSLSSIKTVSTASPIKISLAPKVISSPGRPIIAVANTATAIAPRGATVMSVSRSPVKILPKPVTPTNSARPSVFDKLAAKQASQSQNATVATMPAPVTTVTTGNRSPRRQQSVQK